MNSSRMNLWLHLWGKQFAVQPRALPNGRGSVTVRQCVKMEEMTEPEAAVAILHALKPQESVLLIRRAERAGDPWSGHWSFPGGRRHAEDLDLLQTALRELEEECGIRLGREQMESAMPPAPAGQKGRALLLVAPYRFRVEAELPTILDPREAVEAAWIPLSVLRDPARHSLSSVPGLPKQMQYPAIVWNGVPVWGFTYRVITIWLGLAGSGTG